MQPAARALLWDARRALALVLEFVEWRGWEICRSDPMLRSAVERQFQIVGNALNLAS